MSDSEGSTAAVQPTDDQITQCLKRVTRKGLSSGDFTIKKAREAAEQELGLDAGFFKQHETWKARSKEIVELVVEEDEPSPEKPKPVKPAVKAAGKRKSDEAPAQKTRPRKKARKNESEDELEGEESQTSDVNDDDASEATRPKKAPTKRKPAPKKVANVSDEEEAKSKKKAAVKRKGPATKAAEKVVEDSEASDNDMEGQSPPARKSEKNGGKRDSVKDESELSEEPGGQKVVADGRPPAPEDDESDMSVLIDEPPRKKRGKKSTTEGKPKATSTKSTAAKKKAAGEEPTPEEEEIKRLQGWLVKCGIRKLWHRELADCNTAKAKIKHLKGMLEEAGMTGRYSNEKARDIKERRELAAELEATQEYAKKWGQDKDAGSGDESEGGAQVSEEERKPASRKPKGLVDFGDSGDDGSD